MNYVSHKTNAKQLRKYNNINNDSIYTDIYSVYLSKHTYYFKLIAKINYCKSNLEDLNTKSKRIVNTEVVANVYISGRPGTYRKTDVEDSTKEDAPTQSKDKSTPSKPGHGQTTTKGFYGSKGSPMEGEALPVGDESLPWRQKRKQTAYLIEKEKSQEILTQQQAQPWTQEKVTLRKTSRERKEIKKEKLEEVSLRSTKPKDKDIPKSEMETVDLRHVTDKQEDVTTTVSKKHLSAEKVKHIEDTTLLQVEEDEKIKTQQQVKAKDWRKKRIDMKRLESEEGVSKQRHLDDSVILHIDEASKEDIVDKTEIRSWRKPRKENEVQLQQIEDEQVIPWTKQQIKLKKTLKEKTNTVEEDQNVDQSLITQQHLEDSNMIHISEKETSNIKKHDIAKDWRKPRKPSTNSEEEIKQHKTILEKPTEDTKATIQSKTKDELLPWTNQEIKLKPVARTQKEVPKETIENFELKPVKKPEKQDMATQEKAEETILIKEKITIETNKQLTTKDWRKSRDTVDKPKQPIIDEQKHIEDSTFLNIEQREDKDVQDNLTIKEWRKPRTPSKQLKQPLDEQVSKPDDKQQQLIPKEEPIPWNKQNIKLKSSVRDKKAVVLEKKEDMHRKETETPLKIDKTTKLEEKQLDDTTLLRIDEKEKEDDKKDTIISDWRRPGKSIDKIEQPAVPEKKQIEDTTILHIDDKEKEDRTDKTDTKTWRKSRQLTETTKSPIDQVEIEKTDEYTPDKKLHKPVAKKQPYVKDESIPWNKQEIKLKSTVKDKKEIVTEKIESVKLKPLKKDEKKTDFEPLQAEDSAITQKEEPETKTSEQLTIKDWRKLRKPIDKTEQPAVIENKQTEDTTLLQIENQETVDKPKTRDWRKRQVDKTEQEIKPHRPTENLQQPTSEEVTVPWNKQQIKLKSTVPDKKEITESLEDLQLKPIKKVEKQIVQEDSTTIKQTAIEQQTTKSIKESRKPTDKISNVEQKNVEDIKPIDTDKKEIKTVADQTTVKDWRKPRKQTPKEETDIIPLQKMLEDIDKKPAFADTRELQPIPFEETHLETTALIRINETENVVKEEVPTRAWRKPRKLHEHPSDQQIPTIETVEEINLNKDELQKSSSEVELSKHKEELVPWNKQDIKLKRTIKHKKEKITEKMEDVQLKPVEKPKPQEQKPVDKTDQTTTKRYTQDTISLGVDEVETTDVKDEPIFKDWRKLRKTTTEPIQKDKDTIPLIKDEDQIVLNRTEHNVIETAPEQPTTIAAISELQLSDAKIENVEVQEKVKVTQNKKDAIEEKIHPETKPKEKETTKEIPWTQEKIQLKRTVRDRKSIQKEGIEEVVLKPLQIRDVESEDVSIPKDKKPEKSEVVIQEETTTKASSKTKTKVKPKKQTETVVLQETVTEVEDTVLLKVDEPSTEKIPITENVIEEDIPKDKRRQEVPWRRQKQTVLEKTEDVEKVQLKPLEKVPKLDNKDKVDINLNPLQQKTDQTEVNQVTSVRENDLPKKLPKLPSEEEISLLEEFTKPVQTQEITSEQQVSSTPWRKQEKTNTKEVPEDKPKLKVGKGKLPEEKEFIEKVTLKPIPKRTKDTEHEKLKPEYELVPVKVEETKKEVDIIKESSLKLKKTEDISQEEENITRIQPEEQAESVLPQKELNVEVKSTKSVKEQKKTEYYDDNLPLPELEIISQKRPAQDTVSAPEKDTIETKIVQEEIITKSKKKRPIEKTKPKPPKFIQRLEPVAVEANKPARLTCKVDGLPFPEVAWYKNETLLQPSERVTVNVTEDIIMLEFASVQPQDVAIYSCKAINPAGVATSTANLVILGTNFLLRDLIFV